MTERFVLSLGLNSYPMCQRLTFKQPPRYGIDDWDQMMMQRDKRLTGSIRGQSVSAIPFPIRYVQYQNFPFQDNPKAPPEFATNSIQYTRPPLQ